MTRRTETQPQRDPPETDMLEPVQRLYAKARYHRHSEVKLGPKRIDLLCVRRKGTPHGIAVELKIKDWRRALWQALHNFSVADKSYVAIWHRHERAAIKNVDRFTNAGVGLIVVGPKRAKIVVESTGQVNRIARRQKRAFYKALADKD